MTPLARQLAREIAANGPLTVADYMSRCLGDPEFGYYITRNPFGVAGDFVTAPEISQIFGELIGLWAADLWLQMGKPTLINLVELGPGRGTLLADALRASRTISGFAEAVRIHLVETSQRLRAIQATALPGTQPVWHDSTNSLPGGPMIAIANEFFDALPIHQYVRGDGAWHERLVAVDASGGLRFQLAGSCAQIPAETPGDLIERSPARDAAMDFLCQRIKRDRGAALIVDYGPSVSAPGDTLQAVRGHQPVPVLESPGACDITSHVYFDHLAARADANVSVHGPVTQRHFLLHLGAIQRASELQHNATPTQLEAIEAAIHRLIAPGQMGTLFKALAVTSSGLTPSGFATP